MNIGSTKHVSVAILLLVVSGLAKGQSQDSYQGFRIGMVLSEAVAVGGGNLEQAQAVCANPPRTLSDQERGLLSQVCPKMVRTISGQPTEWEFPKLKLRIAFDKGHIIRVSDFDGVVHLQETLPQSVASVSTSMPTTQGPTSVPRPPTLTSPLPNQDQDVATAAAANRATKAARAQENTTTASAPAETIGAKSVVAKTSPPLPEDSSYEKGRTYAQGQSAGPFGFEKGMTREQIIALVGKNTVKASGTHDDTLEVATAPKPHSAFESYFLVISPNKGLLKVIAMGKTIATGDSGAEIRSAFDGIVTGVTQKYGPPFKAFDFCNGGVGCTDSEYWMLGLLQKNRNLDTYWKSLQSPNHVLTIGINANALSLNSGYITCGFEFEGFNEYAQEKNTNQNNAF
jgi:hypothetical protein